MGPIAGTPVLAAGLSNFPGVWAAVALPIPPCEVRQDAAPCVGELPHGLPLPLGRTGGGQELRWQITPPCNLRSTIAEVVPPDDEQGCAGVVGISDGRAACCLIRQIARPFDIRPRIVAVVVYDAPPIGLPYPPRLRRAGLTVLAGASPRLTGLAPAGSTPSGFRPSLLIPGAESINLVCPLCGEFLQFCRQSRPNLSAWQQAKMTSRSALMSDWSRGFSREGSKSEGLRPLAGSTCESPSRRHALLPRPPPYP